jgi:hypothetical protein
MKKAKEQMPYAQKNMVNGQGKTKPSNMLS